MQANAATSKIAIGIPASIWNPGDDSENIKTPGYNLVLQTHYNSK